MEDLVKMVAYTLQCSIEEAFDMLQDENGFVITEDLLNDLEKEDVFIIQIPEKMESNG